MICKPKGMICMHSLRNLGLSCFGKKISEVILSSNLRRQCLDKIFVKYFILILIVPPALTQYFAEDKLFYY